MSFAVAALAVAALAQSASVTSEAGVAYAAVSGMRSYAAPDLTNAKTSSLMVPFARVSTELGDDWRLGVSYSYIGDLKGSGISPTANIFRDPNIVSAQVETPFGSTEKIHEFGADLRYAWHLSDHISLQLGPVVSLFCSKATIANRSFSSTEAKLGAVADLRFELTKEWQLAAGCRYSRPTDRKITQFAFSVAYSP